MKNTHSFRFADKQLNDRLISLLQRKAPGKIALDGLGNVRYSGVDEDLIGNDLICEMRSSVFPEWQVISFPENWENSYRKYMIKHGVPFREEIRDDRLRFLIPRKFRPHYWKLEEPSRDDSGN